MTIRLTRPGTRAATAQPVHVMATFCAAASWTTSGLATIDVMNIALVITVPWYTARTRNAIVWRPFAGSVPNAVLEMDCNIGNTTPAARAVLLGVAGARTRPVATKLWPRPQAVRTDQGASVYQILPPRPILIQ